MFDNPPAISAAPAQMSVAAAQAALAAADTWQAGVAQQVPGVLAGDKASAQRVTSALLSYAVADKLSGISDDNSRSVLPRRISGAAVAWMIVRPQVGAGVTRDIIDRWLIRQASDIKQTFGTGNSSAGGVLNYNNNLQATGAMTALVVGLSTSTPSLTSWAVSSTKEVLDTIDPSGFTREVTRTDNQKAEYYSHETMNFLVSTAVLSQRAGLADLWSYTGAKAGSMADPALLRAGRLLDADLGNSCAYARQTGKAQIAYPNATRTPLGATVPGGWLLAWVKPFVAHYGQKFPRLEDALSWYQRSGDKQLNSTLGGLLPGVTGP